MINPNQKQPKLAHKAIFCCPEEFCRKSKMFSIHAVNIHLGKKHPELKYKMELSPEGLPLARMT